MNNNSCKYNEETEEENPTALPESNDIVEQVAPIL